MSDAPSNNDATSNLRDIDALLAIMARLRDPQGGCPWDIEQTFATIAPSRRVSSIFMRPCPCATIRAP